MSRGINLYLHVHQPWRIRPYTVFDTAHDHSYFGGNPLSDRTNNEAIMRKVADKSYRPMNALLLELLKTHPEFKVSLSITGTFLEQAMQWTPDVVESFKELVNTGRVEIVGETYYHSLAFFYSRSEFEAQVKAHADLVHELFGVRPRVFRNTELAYNNDLAAWAGEAGYKGIISEGWDPVLGYRSPNYVYRPSSAANIGLLMKNYKLSDDVAFRFSDKNWKEWPLDAGKYSQWLQSGIGDGSVMNLFMDYETFGEHQWSETGIFDFMRSLPQEWLKGQDNTFYTLSEALETHPAVDSVDVPTTITWADTERDLSAWLGNSMQHEAMRHLYDLEDEVLRSGDDGLIHDWRCLQTSDHAYYMCTKWFHDGDVHAYFSPYESPYDAFLYFMNAIRDMRWRVSEHKRARWHV